MQYSILVSLIFLSAVACTNAMLDNPSDKNSSQKFIKLTFLPRKDSSKVKLVEKLPRSNNKIPNTHELYINNPLLQKR